MEEMNNNEKEKVVQKRELEVTNDQVYMLHAIAESLKSLDPSTQVGACFVSEDGSKMLTTSYNHPPRRWDVDKFPWTNDYKKYGIENTKYPYIGHAEASGIIEYKGDLTDSTVYVTLFPCAACALAIALAGIKKVVFLNEREMNVDKMEALRIFNENNIELINYKLLIDNNVTGLEIDFTQDEKHNVKMIHGIYR